MRLLPVGWHYQFYRVMNGIHDGEISTRLCGINVANDLCWRYEVLDVCRCADRTEFTLTPSVIVLLNKTLTSVEAGGDATGWRRRARPRTTHQDARHACT